MRFVLVILVAATIGCAVAWKMGFFKDGVPMDEPPVVSAPVTLAAPPSAPSQPDDGSRRDSILRGIDVQTRRRQEHESRAAGLEAQLKQVTAKIYPPNGSPKVDYEAYMLNQIKAARAARDTSGATNLELQLGDYRGKLKELRTKLAHERDVIAQVLKIIEQEKAKLVP